MNDVIVLDTHPLIWYLINAPTISARAHSLLQTIMANEREAILPTIVLAEMATVIAKHRMTVNIGEFLDGIAETGCRLAPFDEVVLRRYLSVQAALDIHDRIIVATALVYNASVVTKDERIVASATVPVVW